MNQLTHKLLAAAFLASCATACNSDDSAPAGEGADAPGVEAPADNNDSASNDDAEYGWTDDNGEWHPADEDGWTDENGEWHDAPADRDSDPNPADNVDPRGDDDDPRGDDDDPRGDDNDPRGDDNDPRDNWDDSDEPGNAELPAPSVDSTAELDQDAQGRDCLSLTNPSGDGLEICGEWSFDDERNLFIADGDMALKTPAGEIPLLDARLRASDDPVLLHGEANVGLPNLGFLENINAGIDAPRAEIQLAHGRDLEAVEINGIELEPNPDHFYVYFDYSTGLGAEFGPFSVSAPGGSGSTMVIAPEEPFIYLGGDLAGMLTGGTVDDAAIGFSLAGRMPYTTSNELFDGTDWFQPELQGHFFAQGSVQLGSYPVSVAARVFVDADANDDGETVFEAGNERDFVMAADGAVSLGYTKAGFDLSVEVGSGSIMYDASTGPVGSLYVYGEQGIGNILEDTPLEGMISLGGSKTSMFGHFADTDDFSVGIKYENASMWGFNLSEASLSLGTDAVTMTAAVTPPVLNLVGDNEVSMHGELEYNGNFELIGRANAEILGLQLANANLRLNNNGFGVDGRVDIPHVGHADMYGSIESDGSFELNGDAQLAPFGLQLANARLRMSDELRGAYVTARLDARIATVDLTGTLTADTIDLQGTAAVEIPIVVDQEVAQWVTDAAICGAERVTDAARCGADFVANGAVCGYDVVRDAVACGTSWVTSAAQCGTRVVTDAAICGTETVRNAAICGTTTVVNALCEAACFIGGCDCSEVQARSCRVARSCSTPNRCEVANECRIEARCNVPRSCDIPNTCEQRVTVPDVNLGTFRGQATVRIGDQGAGGSVDGQYCTPQGDCVNLGGGRLSLSGNPEACITVPAAGEVCADF